jgi:hypothetical protein
MGFENERAAVLLAGEIHDELRQLREGNKFAQGYAEYLVEGLARSTQEVGRLQAELKKASANARQNAYVLSTISPPEAYKQWDEGVMTAGELIDAFRNMRREFAMRVALLVLDETKGRSKKFHLSPDPGCEACNGTGDQGHGNIYKRCSCETIDLVELIRLVTSTEPAP